MSARVDHSTDWNTVGEPETALSLDAFAREVAQNEVAIGFNAEGIMEITGTHDAPQDRLTDAFHAYTPIIRVLLESWLDKAPRTEPEFSGETLTEIEQVALEIARRRIVLRFAFAGYEHPQTQILVGENEPDPPEDLRRLIWAHQDTIEHLISAFAFYGTVKARN